MNSTSTDCYQVDALMYSVTLFCIICVTIEYKVCDNKTKIYIYKSKESFIKNHAIGINLSNITINCRLH